VAAFLLLVPMRMAAEGLISPEDLDIFTVTDSIDEAVTVIKNFKSKK
jgi:predicted Rossmann-fold nucleotide-binding protein